MYYKKKESDNLLFDLLISFTENDIEKTHSIRNDLLREYFQSSFINGLITIDCDSNICNIINSFITPIFPSITTKKVCGCGTVVKKHAIVEIDYEALSVNGVEQLHASIVQRFITNQSYLCTTCGKEKTVSHVFGDLIFFDVQTIELNDKTIGISKSICLDHVEKIITLNGRDYELMSVIEFIPPLVSKSQGHYVAHCYRETRWYKFDDLQSSYSFSTRKIVPHTFIYYVCS